MRFLVTFALGEEFAPWRKRGGFRVERMDGIEAYRKRDGAVEVLVLVSGAGSGHARRATTIALDREPFDLVISSGLVGGLRPEHAPGTLLVAGKLLRLEDGRELQPVVEWTRLAMEQGASQAVLATAEAVVRTVEEKRQLSRRADAVEMESFDVLETAASRGVPAIAVRAVSDPLDAELALDFNRAFDSRGRVSGTAIAGQLVRRPQAIAGLVRLARDSRRAAENLGEFLERYTRAAAEMAAAKMLGNWAKR